MLLECKCYDMVRRRWLRTMDVIKGYVEVNNDVENETLKYLGEVWTEKESCKCDTISLKRINVSCHKRTIISESESFHSLPRVS